MQHLARKLTIAGIVASFGGSAFAQTPDPATMTCADFMALSADQQMTAMTALRTAGAGSSGATTTTGSPSGAAGSSGNARGMAASGSGAGPDASGSGGAGGEGSSGGDTAGTGSTMASGGTEAAGTTGSGGDAWADPQIAALMAACQDNGTALVMDRMSSM